MYLLYPFYASRFRPLVPERNNQHMRVNSAEKHCYVISNRYVSLKRRGRNGTEGNG